MSNGTPQDPMNPDLKEIIDALTESILLAPEHVLAVAIMKVGRETRRELEYIKYEIQAMRNDAHSARSTQAAAVNALTLAVNSIAGNIYEIETHLRNKSAGD